MNPEALCHSGGWFSMRREEPASEPCREVGSESAGESTSRAGSIIRLTHFNSAPTRVPQRGEPALPKSFDPSAVRRVLIFRLGSLGDTAIALPVFHQIERVFPQAERRLLTNIPIMPKAISAFSLLENSGLVHGFLDYPIGTRSLPQLWNLRKRIRKFRPDVFIYLAQSATRNVRQDERFFRFCSVPRYIGLPATEEYVPQPFPCRFRSL